MSWVMGKSCVDAHCHFHPCKTERHQLYSDRNNLIVVNGCCPEDWNDVYDAYKQFPETVIPQFGLHPWWVGAQESSSGWLDTLKLMLRKTPQAGLGECGLDKSGMHAKTYEEQKHVFQRQIEIAIELQRPLSVHCVRAHGTVFDCIKGIQGRVPVLMHGWSGSSDMVRMFRGLDNVYFSVNAKTLIRLDPARGKEILCALPEERCLLESDGPDGDIRIDLWQSWVEAMPILGSIGNDWIQSCGMPQTVHTTAAIIEAATGRSKESILQRSFENVERIFMINVT